jgi:hypothetical protein
MAKEKKMSLYNLSNSHEKIFSSSFLSQHHDIILYNTLHQIIAFLLFPTNGPSNIRYRYEELREKVILSLNVELFNRAEKEEKDQERLYTIRCILRIPEDIFFPRLSIESYPLWIIKEDFQKIDEGNYFRNIEKFVWALLRSDKTKEAYLSKKSHVITEKEKGEMSLGKSLLKTNVIKFQRKDRLTHERTFEKHFETYKPFCHFIAAYECMRREKQQGWQFSLNQPNQIQRFLNISHWFRKNLLSLKTPGVNEKVLFSEEDLVSLPTWVQGDEVDIPIEPGDNEIHEIGSSFLESLAPSCKTRIELIPKKS